MNGDWCSLEDASHLALVMSSFLCQLVKESPYVVEIPRIGEMVNATENQRVLEIHVPLLDSDGDCLKKLCTYWIAKEYVLGYFSRWQLN